jgi:hypothetical protein
MALSTGTRLSPYEIITAEAADAAGIPSLWQFALAGAGPNATLSVFRLRGRLELGPIAIDNLPALFAPPGSRALDDPFT